MSLDNNFEVLNHLDLMVAGLDQMIKLYAETKQKLLKVQTKEEYDTVLEVFMKLLGEMEDVSAPGAPDGGRPGLVISNN